MKQPFYKGEPQNPAHPPKPPSTDCGFPCSAGFERKPAGWA